MCSQTRNTVEHTHAQFVYGSWSYEVAAQQFHFSILFSLILVNDCDARRTFFYIVVVDVVSLHISPEVDVCVVVVRVASLSLVIWFYYRVAYICVCVCVISVCVVVAVVDKCAHETINLLNIM